MKVKASNPTRLDILGNGHCSSAREVLTAILKQWRQKLVYCSIFAAVPAILVSQVEGARSEDEKKPDSSVAEQAAKPHQRPNLRFSSTALLKQQAKFRLPHQKSRFSMLAALAGNDDCPGSPIPGGNYTAGSPYTDSRDTTGANNTVSSVFYYYYYTIDTMGADHVYSFTLSGRGPNPQIQVSTTSATYRPIVYVLLGGPGRVCPAGTGNTAVNTIVMDDSRWRNGNIATLNASQINFLPLNVPLHLFVDSRFNDATGSGPYTLRMQDVTIAGVPACTNPNPIDCTDVFVRQHYLDFLNREPDPPGFTTWVNGLNNCAPGDTSCDRVQVSSTFFRSPEFQERGYFVYRFYSVSFGRKPDLAEFTPDLQRVSGFLTPAELEIAKTAFVNDFVSRNAFRSRYDSLSNSAYVDTLLSTAGVTLSTRQALIDGLNNGSFNRGQVLRHIVEATEVHQRYFNEAFVVMQYFGYLRRDPDALYLDWIQMLDTTGDVRGMVSGFVNSLEYRFRFGP